MDPRTSRVDARFLVIAFSVCLNMVVGPLPAAADGARGWIVVGNKNSSGVPTCSYCLNIYNPPSDNFTGHVVVLYPCVASQVNEFSWLYNPATKAIEAVDLVGQVLCLDAGTQEYYDGRVSQQLPIDLGHDLKPTEDMPFFVDVCNVSRLEQQWFYNATDKSIQSALKSPDRGEALYMAAGKDVATRFSVFLCTEAGFSAAPYLGREFTFQSYNATTISGLSVRQSAEEDTQVGLENLLVNGGFERCSVVPPDLLAAPSDFMLCGWQVTSTRPPKRMTTNYDINGTTAGGSNGSILLVPGSDIVQTIPKKPSSGSEYALSFSLAGYLVDISGNTTIFGFCSESDSNREALTVKLNVSCVNESNSTQSGVHQFPVRQPSTQAGDVRWSIEILNYSCEGHSTVVQFSVDLGLPDRYSPLCGPVIDNVKVIERLRNNSGTSISPGPSGGRTRRPYLKIPIICSLAASVLVLMLVMGGIYWYLRSVRHPSPSISANGKNRLFSRAELNRATHNFSRDHVLGEGGFSTVYKANFPGGVTAAVKVEKANSRGAGRTSTSTFAEEVALLQQVHHKYLVHFMGFCKGKGTRMLVFEYLPNGSLHDRLHSKTCHGTTAKGLQPLSWLSRMNIAYQVACALEYLHHETSPPIVHRDIKSANILLTSTDSAKLADFGLSKAGPADATHFLSVQTGVKGSFGYMDPGYIRSGVFSPKSDVYSFGVVVLELITGYRALKDGDLLSIWALEQLRDSSTTSVDDLVDRRLQGEWNSADLVILLDLVKMCLQENGQRRPTMQQVVSYLEDQDFSGVPRPLSALPDGAEDSFDEEVLEES